MIYLKARNEKDLSFTFIGIGEDEGQAISGLLFSIMRVIHNSPQICECQDTMRHAIILIRASYPKIPARFCYQEWHFDYGQIKS